MAHVCRSRDKVGRARDPVGAGMVPRACSAGLVNVYILPVVLAAVSAVSGAVIEKKETCVKTCGSVCYYQSDIDEAVSQGYGYFQDGETVGSQDYPHQYNDYEGFDFPDPGPWYEFPILSTYKAYTGGEPGADRVVFDGDGKYQDTITHTGASGDDFVECKSA